MARWVLQLWKAVAGTARSPAAAVSETATAQPFRPPCTEPGDAVPEVSAATATAPSTPKRLSEEGALLDLRVIADIRALMGPGYPDPLGEVVDLYLTHTAPRIDDIENAIAESDAAALAMIAHTLKSSSASVGAAATAIVAGQLEAIGASGTTAGAEQRLHVLKEQFPQVAQALRDACDQGDP